MRQVPLSPRRIAVCVSPKSNTGRPPERHNAHEDHGTSGGLLGLNKPAGADAQHLFDREQARQRSTHPPRSIASAARAGNSTAGAGQCCSPCRLSTVTLTGLGLARFAALAAQLVDLVADFGWVLALWFKPIDQGRVTRARALICKGYCPIHSSIACVGNTRIGARTGTSNQ